MEPYQAGQAYYRWRFGDTVEDVAKAHDISAEDLRRINPDIPFDHIAPGVAIRVPNEAFACPRGTWYVVLEGDSLASIAEAHDIDLLSLIEQNPYADPTALIEGQLLCIPKRRARRQAPPLGGQTATLRYGETLEAFARRQGLDANQLLASNPALERSALYPGRKIALSPGIA